MLSVLRWLRHGPLAGIGPLWPKLGRCYRAVSRFIPGWSVRQNIGPYGPFRLIPEFSFSDFVSWGGAHNRGFRYCIEACRGKTCVFDVGAHIGLVALPAASVLAQGGKVYAFEPAKTNADILRKHLALNKQCNIEVIEALVGDSDRQRVPFFESAGPHGQNSIVLKDRRTLKSEWGAYSRTERPQISLDSYCGQHALKPAVIKIDVEGAEVGVLRGARAVIRNCRPLIILSVHPRQIALAGETLEALREILEEFYYEVRDVDGRPVSEFKLDEYVVAPRVAPTN